MAARKEEKRSTTVNVKPGLRDRLKVAAAQAGMSMGDMVEEALVYYLDHFRSYNLQKRK